MIAPASRMALGLSLADLASRPMAFPGLEPRPVGRMRLIVLEGSGARQVVRGSVPEWGVGLALPGSRTIIIRTDAPDPAAVLRHELAHLALHDAIRSRVPLWFDEGYAVVAAGEVARFRGLQLNLAVARGRVGGFDALDRMLRQDALRAGIAYALAGSAVLHLLRLQPSGSLAPLIDRLAAGEPFAEALERTTGYTTGTFERSWRTDLRRRYNVFLWLGAGGGWAVLAAAVAGIAWWRRRRDRPRRAALDEGWVAEGWQAEVGEGGDPLDPGHSAG